MNTNLLKEAIADADAIKKMAIENAKASLNEAFDSKIKNMLALRLEEEADELEEEYDEKDEAALFEKKKKGMEDGEEGEEKHAEPDEDNMGGESDEDEDNMKEKYGEDEANEEFNLDELLAELEEGDDEEAPVEPEEGDDEGYMAEEEDEDGMKKDMDEEIDIAALLAELADEDQMEEAKDEEEGEEEDEMKSLEEEMMSLLEKMKEKKKAKADKEEKEKEKPESEELQEIKRQAAELTQKVNETNLINAKLLYLNKILRKYNLSEQQKIKVISAFDKAETVNESKIVHESLDQAFSVKNDNIKSGLKESIGFASSAAGTSTKRVITESVIDGADKQVSRWQKLAGIIK